MKKFVFILAILLTAALFAQSVQETENWTNAPSQGGSGILTYNRTLTGGYTMGELTWDGWATPINAATYGSELTCAISGPLGSTTVTLGSGTTWTGSVNFTGSTFAFDGAGDPAGVWTFDFYETYDDGGDSQPDANWDSIDFDFYDQGAPTYCTTSYSNTTDDWITRVQFNTIDQSSGSVGYEDYTGVSTTVYRNSSYDLYVDIQVQGSWIQHCWAWIDWNQDMDFTDTGEAYDMGDNGGASGAFQFSTNITVPAGATLGSTRMRVSEKYSSDPGPCEVYSYGEAEDYTIIVADTPVPVTLTDFTAEYTVEGLTLFWTTQSEIDNMGWNIYRGEEKASYLNDETLIINPQLIQGQGTTSEPTDYTFTDENELVANQTYWYWIESIAFSGVTDIHGPVSLTIPEGSEDPEPEPDSDEFFGLLQNVPNPLSNTTSIGFTLKEATNCELTIYNTKGQIIKTFVKNDVADGSFLWDGKDEYGKDVKSGLYFYKLNAGDETFIKKMILTR